MDKQEYREIVSDIRRAHDNQEYDKILMYADELDMRKVSDSRVLEMISDAYVVSGDMETAKELLLKAYEKTPMGRKLAYKLSEISLLQGDLDGAVDFYEDFCKMAPHDNDRYLLKYKIGKAGGLPGKDLVKVLAAYCDKEVDEKWMAELAGIYDELGETEKCGEVCDDIILWFADGVYVQRALEMKSRNGGLTQSQEAKLEQLKAQAEAAALAPDEPDDLEEDWELRPGDMETEGLQEEELDSYLEEFITVEDAAAPPKPPRAEDMANAMAESDDIDYVDITEPETEVIPIDEIREAADHAEDAQRNIDEAKAEAAKAAAIERAAAGEKLFGGKTAVLEDLELKTAPVHAEVQDIIGEKLGKAEPEEIPDVLSGALPRKPVNHVQKRPPVKQPEEIKAPEPEVIPEEAEPETVPEPIPEVPEPEAVSEPIPEPAEPEQTAEEEPAFEKIEAVETLEIFPGISETRGSERPLTTPEPEEGPEPIKTIPKTIVIPPILRDYPVSEEPVIEEESVDEPILENNVNEAPVQEAQEEAAAGRPFFSNIRATQSARTAPPRDEASFWKMPEQLTFEGEQSDPEFEEPVYGSHRWFEEKNPTEAQYTEPIFGAHRFTPQSEEETEEELEVSDVVIEQVEPEPIVIEPAEEEESPEHIFTIRTTSSGAEIFNHYAATKSAEGELLSNKASLVKKPAFGSKKSAAVNTYADPVAEPEYFAGTAYINVDLADAPKEEVKDRLAPVKISLPKTAENKRLIKEQDELKELEKEEKAKEEAPVLEEVSEEPLEETAPEEAPVAEEAAEEETLKEAEEAELQAPAFLDEGVPLDQLAETSDLYEKEVLDFEEAQKEEGEPSEFEQAIRELEEERLAEAEEEPEEEFEETFEEEAALEEPEEETSDFEKAVQAFEKEKEIYGLGNTFIADADSFMNEMDAEAAVDDYVSGRWNQPRVSLEPRTVAPETEFIPAAEVKEQIELEGRRGSAPLILEEEAEDIDAAGSQLVAELFDELMPEEEFVPEEFVPEEFEEEIEEYIEEPEVFEEEPEEEAVPEEEPEFEEEAVFEAEPIESEEEEAAEPEEEPEVVFLQDEEIPEEGAKDKGAAEEAEVIPELAATVAAMMAEDEALEQSVEEATEEEEPAEEEPAEDENVEEEPVEEESTEDELTESFEQSIDAFGEAQKEPEEPTEFEETVREFEQELAAEAEEEPAAEEVEEAPVEEETSEEAPAEEEPSAEEAEEAPAEEETSEETEEETSEAEEDEEEEEPGPAPFLFSVMPHTQIEEVVPDVVKENLARAKAAKAADIAPAEEAPTEEELTESFEQSIDAFGDAQKEPEEPTEFEKTIREFEEAHAAEAEEEPAREEEETPKVEPAAEEAEELPVEEAPETEEAEEAPQPAEPVKEGEEDEAGPESEPSVFIPLNELRVDGNTKVITPISEKAIAAAEEPEEIPAPEEAEAEEAPAEEEPQEEIREEETETQESFEEAVLPEEEAEPAPVELPEFDADLLMAGDASEFERAVQDIELTSHEEEGMDWEDEYGVAEPQVEEAPVIEITASIPNVEEETAEEPEEIPAEEAELEDPDEFFLAEVLPVELIEAAEVEEPEAAEPEESEAPQTQELSDFEKAVLAFDEGGIPEAEDFTQGDFAEALEEVVGETTETLGEAEAESMFEELAGEGGELWEEPEFGLPDFEESEYEKPDYLGNDFDSEDSYHTEKLLEEAEEKEAAELNDFEKALAAFEQENKEAEIEPLLEEPEFDDDYSTLADELSEEFSGEFAAAEEMPKEEPELLSEFAEVVVPTAPEDDGSYRIPDDLREELYEFLLIDGMESRISKAIGNLIEIKRQGDPTGGNLIVTGDAKSGKTYLTISVIKAVAKEIGSSTGRVAKVKAESLNGKDMKKVFRKISGSDLIIENAGYLSDDTIANLVEAMETSQGASMVVLEGNQLGVENILTKHPELEALFKTRLNLDELSLSQWADLACEYAEEKGYKVGDMALLALHAKIDEMNLPTTRLVVEDVQGIIDSAIEKANKRGSGRFLGRKKGREGVQELEESDFI